MDADYTPWIVLHRDPTFLSDKALLAAWSELTEEDIDSPEVMETYAEILQAKGYTIPHIAEQQLVLPVDGRYTGS
jgi:hypothetical protein